ncbi:MAG: 2Fe-2S iron-sulfur cluster binding domain-containing protein [Kordiimonadaceae bacterium]|jgi:ferredoxin, 2Fe-2S|nr:2Fe-2S iron-sulfur cluster binding domain-containing protein [Kordiimonadaceae bacterium]
MPTLTYISPDNKEQTVEAELGHTLMEIAVNNDIDGIDADCGGGCACATCHIVIPQDYRKIAGQADEDESSLLDFLDNRTIGSRLSCQIEMSEELDGMTVKVLHP